MDAKTLFTRTIEGRLTNQNESVVVVLPTTREHFMCVSRNVSQQDSFQWLLAGLDSCFLDVLDEGDVQYSEAQQKMCEMADFIRALDVDWED